MCGWCVHGVVAWRWLQLSERLRGCANNPGVLGLGWPCGSFIFPIHRTRLRFQQLLDAQEGLQELRILTQEELGRRKRAWEAHWVLLSWLPIGSGLISITAHLFTCTPVYLVIRSVDFYRLFNIVEGINILPAFYGESNSLSNQRSNAILFHISSLITMIKTSHSWSHVRWEQGYFTQCCYDCHFEVWGRLDFR